MANHSLRPLTIPIPRRFQRVQNAAHLFLLLLCHLNLSRSKVLFQTLRFSGPWDGNHALSNHPCQSNLRQRAALTLGEGLDLLDDFLVVVEVLALEFGYCCVGIVRQLRCLDSHRLPTRERGRRYSPVRRKSSCAKSSGLS